MKSHYLALLFLAAILPVRADDWLVNGDFSDGLHAWHGEGQSAGGDTDPDANPLATPSATSAPAPKGVQMTLRSEWIKETQDFKVKSENAVIKVTYVINPGTKFSTKQDDFNNVPDKMGWDAWGSFNTQPNSFLIFISILGKSKASRYEAYEPDWTSNQEQTVELPLDHETAGDEGSIAIAFPPGTGSVTIHSVTITNR